MNQADYRNIISGQKTGIAAVLVRFVLCGISLPYLAIVQFRNLLYDKKILKSHQANLAVISIGNITAGGTGKTPLVIWLTKRLCTKYKCAILTRGYKSTSRGSDEAKTLAQTCANVPVIINPNRVAGAADAVKIHGSEVLILDDGFQHRRLARDIDIIAIDATCPFGYGKILPGGLLREPVASVKRAKVAIITRVDNVQSVEGIETRLLSYNKSLIIAHSIHKPSAVITSAKETLEPKQLAGKKIFAFCGLGNPDAFFNTLSSIGCEITDRLIFNDHHSYTKNDIDEIQTSAATSNAEVILTTAKDFVKIDQKWLKNTGIDIAYLDIEIEITKAAEKITELIEKTIAVKIGQSA